MDDKIENVEAARLFGFAGIQWNAKYDASGRLVAALEALGVAEAREQ